MAQQQRASRASLLGAPVVTGRGAWVGQHQPPAEYIALTGWWLRTNQSGAGVIQSSVMNSRGSSAEQGTSEMEISAGWRVGSFAYGSSAERMLRSEATSAGSSQPMCIGARNSATCSLGTMLPSDSVWSTCCLYRLQYGSREPPAARLIFSTPPGWLAMKFVMSYTLLPSVTHTPASPPLCLATSALVKVGRASPRSLSLCSQSASGREGSPSGRRV
eukprot:scaffold18898_cov29-Tisochrysis_lutea.AAC.4